MQGEPFELIENKYHLFLRRRNVPSTGESEDIEFAKQAFLYVVTNCRADECHKISRLWDINCWQDLEGFVSEEEILRAFESYFYTERKKSGVLPLAEFIWVGHFVESYDVLRAIEKMVYISLLSSKNYNRERKSYSWTMTEAEKLAIVLEEMGGKQLGTNRDSEIAYEFGLPDPGRLDQLRRFLRNGQLDLAKKLDVVDQGIALEVINEKYAKSRLEDALHIAQNFLPEDHAYIKKILLDIELIPLEER